MKAAKAKYQNLRTYFVKEFKKTQSTRSGDGTSEVYKPTWPYFESLLFLAPTVELRETESTIRVSNGLHVSISIDAAYDLLSYGPSVSRCNENAY